MAGDFSHIQLDPIAATNTPADYSHIQLDQSSGKATFNGLSSTQPLNQSDLSLEDRFKMGFGNERGNIDYLTKLGYDAKLNDKKELVYRRQDDKLWRYVDEKDSWSLSESIKDVAEAAPEILSFATQTGASVLASTMVGAGLLSAPFSAGAGGVAGVAAAAGTMAAATAAAKAANISFGRHFDTYQAEPAEMIQDLALETLVGGIGGAGGKALELGGRAGARWIGEGLRKSNEFAKSGGEASKNVVTFLTKVGLGVPDDAAELIVTQGDKIDDALKPFGATANARTIKEALDTNNVGLTRKLADHYKQAGDVIYRRSKNAIIDAAEAGGLEFQPLALADDVMNSIGPFFEWSVKGVKDEPIGNAANALLRAKGNVDLISVQLKSNAQIAALVDEGIKTNNEMYVAAGKLLSGAGGREQLHSGMNRVIPNILAFEKKKGGQAAKVFMEVDQLLSNQFHDMFLTANAEGNKSLARGFTMMNERVSSLFANTLDKASNGTFSAMKGTYKTIREGLNVFDTADKAFRGGDKMAYAKLYNSLKTQSTLGTYRKSMLEPVDAIIRQNMPNLSKRLDHYTNKIDVNLAASHFAPWVNPKIAAYAVGVGGGIGLATGDPSAGLGIGGMALLTSPRLASKAYGAAARAYQGVNSGLAAQLAQGGIEAVKGFQMIKGVSSLLKKDAIHGAKAAVTASTLEQMLKGYIQLPSQQQQQTQQLLQQGGVR